MKKIKYNLCTRVNHGTEENPDIKEILTPVEMDWSVSNMEIARREAYGEPEIYDDGQPDPVAEPTTEELLNTILGVTV
jgi:hypothetical protein